jgi:hypothetical protein
VSRTALPRKQVRFMHTPIIHVLPDPSSPISPTYGFNSTKGQYGEHIVPLPNVADHDPCSSFYLHAINGASPRYFPAHSDHLQSIHQTSSGSSAAKRRSQDLYNSPTGRATSPSSLYLSVSSLRTAEKLQPTVSQRPSDSPMLSSLVCLNPAYKAYTHLLYDVRHPPSDALSSSPYSAPKELTPFETYSPVAGSSTTMLYLVSRYFPWVITVQNPRGVTCGDLTSAVYYALNQPVTHDELTAFSEKDRQKVFESFYSNRSSDFGGLGPRASLERVDCLGAKTILCGLTEDPTLAASRMPDPRAQRRTLALVFRSS